MSDGGSGDITVLLERWNAGDAAALEALASVTYDDLRLIAIGFLRREHSDHTLQATALVSELFVRLVGQRALPASNRVRFYRFAAMMMRRILTDYARRSLAEKRPARADRLPLHPDIAWVDASSDEMLELDRALAELEQVDTRTVQALELRYFLGCTTQEASDLLGVSTATVDRDVTFGLAWLHRRLTGAATASAKGISRD